MKFLIIMSLVCLGVPGILPAFLRKDQSQVFHWGYQPDNGPSVWPEYYPMCGSGTSQSPIDIVTSNVVPGSDLPFYFGPNWSSKGKDWTMVNNGHSVEIEVPDGWDFGGGDLPAGDNYMLKQFHFHWGSVDSQGSEHTLNGFAYPIEMHMVCWDEAYASYEDAAAQPDGLAVLGIFFEVSQIDNPDLHSIINAMPSVTQPDTTVVVNDIHLENLIAPVIGGKYWRYNGSFTTPDCAESKVWSIFENTLSISESQLNVFRSLFAEPGVPLVNNYRPTQPLNGRVVYEQ